jgi:hypothetical protein
MFKIYVTVTSFDRLLLGFLYSCVLVNIKVLFTRHDSFFLYIVIYSV